MAGWKTAPEPRRSFRWFLPLVCLGLGLTLLSALPLHATPGMQTRHALSLQERHQRQAPCLEAELLPVDPLASPRPPGGDPLAVSVQLHIDDIPEISSTEDSFTFDGFLDVSWCDKRLAAELNPGETERAFANEGAVDFLKAHWEPQVTFVNELGAAEGDDFTFLIRNNGIMELTRHTQLKLASNFDLRRFPFDRQLLELDVQSFAWDSSVLRFVDQPSMFFSKKFDIPDWNIVAVKSRVMDVKNEDHGDRYMSQILGNLRVERKSEFYLYKIFMPLAILSFTSIFFLAIPIQEMGDRIGFVSGLLFTTLAYQLIIASSVPRVPYFTLGDRYTLFLFFFMVAEVFIAYAISLVARFGPADGALSVEKVELGFEISLPIIFVLVNLYFVLQARA